MDVPLLRAIQVEGPRDKGRVNLHMIKRPGAGEFEYKYLALDVEGEDAAGHWTSLGVGADIAQDTHAST